MTKVSDFIHRFSRGGIIEGICRVRTFVTPADGVIAVLTDVGEHNPGASVSNSVEWIRESLLARGLVLPDAKILLHYEWGTFGDPFVAVSFDADGNPDFDRMQLDDAARLVGCSIDEFKATTDLDPRLNVEMVRIRNAIDPFADSPEVEPPAVYNRRAEIQARMISKTELSLLVRTGASERKIQDLLKRDFSIIAEIYANPKEEYICFSEFPIANGVVDFVLFTGRSRMDVVLIEIKGANFGLVNSGSYGNFSAKINEAAQQIRSRLSYAYREMTQLGTALHDIRSRVESGETLYRSFIGPQGPLEVDPDKDICLHGVVIGGRTRNDLEESRQRNNYEHGQSPPVRLESWDSWLKKLERR